MASGAWEPVSETFFDVPVHYRDFAEFEQRMIGVTYQNHRLDAATLGRRARALRAAHDPRRRPLRATDAGQPAEKGRLNA